MLTIMPQTYYSKRDTQSYGGDPIVWRGLVFRLMIDSTGAFAGLECCNYLSTWVKQRIFTSCG